MLHFDLKQKIILKEILYWVIGIILLFSGIMKGILLISKEGRQLGHLLGIEAIEMSWLVLAAALLELFIAGIVLGSHTKCRLGWLILLSISFASYRAVLYFFNIPTPCSCLGAAPQLLGMGKGADNLFSWMIFGVFIIAVLCLAYLELRRDNEQSVYK